MSILITLALIYLLVHLLFAGSHFHHYRHRSFLQRCRLSVPGPFHIRISRNL